MLEQLINTSRSNVGKLLRKKKKGAPEIETEVLGAEGEGSAGRTHRIFKTV